MIEVKQLTKFFGEKKAVDDISFSVEQGEVLGFLGPNAAGKSTTMRMITGFLPPSSGTATIGGMDIMTQSLAARKKMGYLPENAPVYPDMTVMSFLEFIAGIRGFSGSDRTRKVEDVLNRCFLTEVRHQPISTLSKGFKQRVCFAQSIIHDPEYLIMDEPTDGLDPNQKHEVRSMIREMARDKTIILSTHILEEVDALCSRAIIISNGRIVADDTPAGLKTRSTTHGAVMLSLSKIEDMDVVDLIRKLPEVSDVTVLDQREGNITLRAFPRDSSRSPAERIMALLVQEGVRIDTFQVETGRLDEVFRNVTEAAQEEGRKHHE